VGIFVIGTAVCNLPSGYIFNHYGRHGGFVMGSLLLILGGALGSLAVAAESLVVLYLGSFMLGIGVGFGQFYRFAAIEMASAENKGWAVTTVLMGGCVAAFFGPTLGLLSKEMFNAQYAGSFFMMVVLGLLNLGTIFFIPFPPEATIDRALSNDAHPVTINPVTSSAGHSSATVIEEVHQRSANHPAPNEYMSIYVSRTFVNATLVSTIAQILMLIMMIGSILKMNDLGFTLVQQALVLDFHFFAMFGTGFFTSYLLKALNIYAVLAVAWGLIGVAVIFFLCSDSLWAFFIGDFLVGVGWNIMFSTGTVMLSFCYAPHQRHHVQSIFEIIINSISGIFTIVSGIMLSQYGWNRLVYGILGIFAALSLIAPLYGRYYTDSSAVFADKKPNSGNSDIECSGVDA
jgi:MFS family permease